MTLDLPGFLNDQRRSYFYGLSSLSLQSDYQRERDSFTANFYGNFEEVFSISHVRELLSISNHM